MIMTHIIKYLNLYDSYDLYDGVVYALKDRILFVDGRIVTSKTVYFQPGRLLYFSRAFILIPTHRGTICRPANWPPLVNC